MKQFEIDVARLKKVGESTLTAWFTWFTQFIVYQKTFAMFKIEAFLLLPKVCRKIKIEKKHIVIKPIHASLFSEPIIIVKTR